MDSQITFVGQVLTQRFEQRAHEKIDAGPVIDHLGDIGRHLIGDAVYRPAFKIGRGFG